MAWIYLIIAGIFETGFAVSLKLMDGHKNLFWSVLFYISIISSFCFLSLAMRAIPIGTAYAVWTGIGTAGVALIGFWFLHEPMPALKAGFLLMLIISIIGLKYTTQ